MLAWTFYGAGLALVVVGVVLSIWRRRAWANGLTSLGNVCLVGFNLIRDDLGFAALHLVLAVGALLVWLLLASRENA